MSFLARLHRGRRVPKTQGLLCLKYVKLASQNELTQLFLHWIVAPVSFSTLGSLLPISYPCLGCLGSEGSQREFITSGSHVLDLKHFLGSDATIKFIHLFESLFGILNFGAILFGAFLESLILGLHFFQIHRGSI